MRILIPLTLVAAAATVWLLRKEPIPPTPASTTVDAAPTHTPAPGPREVHDPAATPRVLVTDAEGRPVSGARVSAAISRDHFKSNQTVEARSDDRGGCAIEWPRGAWLVLSAWADGMTPASIVVTDDEADDARIVLKRGSPLSGRVIARAGAPVPNARLRFEPIIPQKSFADRVLSTLKFVDADVVTDAEGRFNASPLRDADYRVIFADAPNRPAPILRASDLRAGNIEIRAQN